MIPEKGAKPIAQKFGEWLTGMMRAPVVIVPLSHKDAYLERYAQPDKGWTDRDEARWPVPYWDVDTGMASLLMLLTAVDEGLGAWQCRLLMRLFADEGLIAIEAHRLRRTLCSPQSCRKTEMAPG